MNRHPFSEKNTYIFDQQIISGSDIWEYDIRQANINMLYSYGVISYNEYTQLANSPKYVREIYIGKREQFEKLKSKKSITEETIKKGITEAKDQLLMSNKIQPKNIIRIANDAIYVESPNPLQYTIFDLNNNNKFIEFACKNHFSTVIKFSNKVVVFFGIRPDDNFNVDVKGINDEVLEYQVNSVFLSLICEILFYKERTDKDTTLRVFNDYYHKYINRELPIDYYREFNSSSAFRLLNQNTQLMFHPAPTLLPDSFDKNKIDISYNMNILRELYGAILR